MKNKLMIIAAFGVALFGINTASAHEALPITQLDRLIASMKQEGFTAESNDIATAVKKLQECRALPEVLGYYTLKSHEKAALQALADNTTRWSLKKNRTKADAKLMATTIKISVNTLLGLAGCKKINIPLKF